MCCLDSRRIWGSSVSILSDYRLDDRGSIPDRGRGFFSLASVSRPALRLTQPPVQWVPGGPFPGGKARLGPDAEHSPPSTAEVNNEELYFSPPWRLHGGSGTALLCFLIYSCLYSERALGSNIRIWNHLPVWRSQFWSEFVKQCSQLYPDLGPHSPFSTTRGPQVDNYDNLLK
jgi:hypothetical protein